MTPSKTRTVEYCRAARPPHAQLSWGIKTPFSTLDFSLDLRNWLADLDGDTIESCSAIFTTAGAAGNFAITVQPEPGPVLTTWLFGGTIGTIYAVSLTWATANGRSETAQVWLTVQPIGTAIVQGVVIAVGPPGPAWVPPPPSSPISGQVYYWTWKDGVFCWVTGSAPSTSPFTLDQSHLDDPTHLLG